GGATGIFRVRTSSSSTVRTRSRRLCLVGSPSRIRGAPAMPLSISFHGGAGTVTGSKYLVRAGKTKVLVDCGMFQGIKLLREMNWQGPGFHANEPDAILLTHAHIDHTGYLPRLVAQGFRGPVYCTPAT